MKNNENNKRNSVDTQQFVLLFIYKLLNQIQNCSIQIKKMRDEIITFQLKKHYFCRTLADDARHKNVLSPLDLT